MSVYQRVAQGKILCQAHQRVINGGITMRMVTSKYGTDSIRTLTVRFFRRQTVFIHGIQDSSVDGLKAVPYVRKSTADDDRHRVGKERFLHFLLNVYRDDRRIV